jgi:hypothetical protein
MVESPLTDAEEGGANPDNLKYSGTMKLVLMGVSDPN